MVLTQLVEALATSDAKRAGGAVLFFVFFASGCPPSEFLVDAAYKICVRVRVSGSVRVRVWVRVRVRVRVRVKVTGTHLLCVRTYLLCTKLYCAQN